MKKSTIFITFFFLTFILSGCFGNIIEKQLNPWIGQTEVQLIHKWGTPARDYPDGEGGKILVYNQRSSDGSTRVTQMYINKQGKIYHWRVHWD